MSDKLNSNEEVQPTPQPQAEADSAPTATSAPTPPSVKTPTATQTEAAPPGEVVSSPEQTPAEAVDKCTLTIAAFDAIGRPIPKLGLQVLKRTSANVMLPVFEGITGPGGVLPPIDTMPIGQTFEVRIKTDRGDYKFAAIGTLTSKECVGNLMLRQRFEFSTYSHKGTPGTAEATKKALAATHTQAGDGKLDVKRNAAPPQATVILDRNKDGYPVGIVKSGQRNMLGQNRLNPRNPNIELQPEEKLKQLMAFCKEQLTWVHPKEMTSQVIITRMKASTYNYETRTEALGYAKSIGRCAKYVKIALWKAGYIDGDDDFMPTEGSASRLGPGLVAAGFTDITKELPDARWAAPGDVIVYRKIDAPDAAGHIDIRTYDGYASDFWDSYLPVSTFEVTGIYRRYSDPLPEKRMRAFLKVIRSREAETLFVNSGDAASYTALPLSGHKKGMPLPAFDSFKEHPFANSSVKGLHASGAYGITLDSWRRMLAKWVKVPASDDRFSPVVQDRIAVALMELHPGQGYGTSRWQTTDPTSLALVRQGKVHEAATQLATRRDVQWPSLPGGSQTKYTLEKFDADYGKFFSELA